jgi:hypothetical protein
MLGHYFVQVQNKSKIRTRRNKSGLKSSNKNRRKQLIQASYYYKPAVVPDICANTVTVFL